jgi:hypothetical protein
MDKQEHLQGRTSQSTDDATDDIGDSKSNGTANTTQSNHDHKEGTMPVASTDIRENQDTTSSPNNVDSTSIPDVTTMTILRDLGEKLEFEHRQRKRADDWADFLTLELDAHIEARTSAEERHIALRERMIRLVGKYRKLKSEHATLVTQIKDMTVDDASAHKPAEKNRGSILRRNKSVGDRQAIMAKRNAMLIRGSRRHGSSDDSDSSEEASTGKASHTG